MKPEEITLVVLARNEGSRLAATLAGVPPQIRRLVVDAESTDRTVAVARAAGAEVIVRPWPGFVAARREALAFVQTPWTLMLDADERLDSALAAAILAADGASAGYRMRRTTFFCGRAIVGCGWGEERPL
ncbi:MAG: glycosyltransferase, partial [Vulcanimicrobiaceae bacterium]